MKGGTKGQRLYPLYMGKHKRGEYRREEFRNLAKAMGYTRHWGGQERGEPGGMVSAMIDAWVNGGQLGLGTWMLEHAEILLGTSTRED